MYFTCETGKTREDGMRLEEQTDSYMRLGIHIDGKNSKELRVPTFWDDIKKEWIGAIQLPKSKKLITASGKDSFSLKNAFNLELFKTFQSEYGHELMSMFE